MAQSPEQQNQATGAGKHSRLLSIALILLVSALVGVGAWALASANDSALLNTVEQEPATAEAKDDEAASKDEDSAKKESKKKKDKSKKKSSKSAKDSSEKKPAANGDEGEGQQDEAGDEQDDAAEDGGEEDQPQDEEQHQSSSQSASSGSGGQEQGAEDYGVEDSPDPGETPYAPAPEPEPEPESEPEPTTVEVYVTVDGTPAGGSWRDTSVTLPVGSTAYDALLACGASVNARNTVYGMYVAAIDGLAEKDYGSMSGWVYAVNGVEPPTACSNYVLGDGDSVVWTYVNVEW